MNTKPKICRVEIYDDKTQKMVAGTFVPDTLCFPVKEAMAYIEARVKYLENTNNDITLLNKFYDAESAFMLARKRMKEIQK